MRHVFFGHDDRIRVGTTAFLSSVIEHASEPLSITPITRRACGGVPEGSNAFTFRRFLVPSMMSFTGLALYVDGSDMLCRSDICEIFRAADWYSAVQVVKHDYQTRNARKYRGTAMESDNADYPRKQWASVMLINCAHYAWRKVTPEFIAKADPMELLQLRFISDDRIGELPAQWNWLVDEHGENEDSKILHFTAGVPAMPAHSDAPMAAEWRGAVAAAVSVAP